MAKVRMKFEQTTPTERRKMVREIGRRLDVPRSLESLIERMHG
jgi:hypothetical protein